MITLLEKLNLEALVFSLTRASSVPLAVQDRASCPIVDSRPLLGNFNYPFLISDSLAFEDIPLASIQAFYRSEDEKPRAQEVLSLLKALLLRQLTTEHRLAELSSENLLNRQELQLFYEVSAALTSVFDVKQICHIILNKLIRTLGVERVSIMLLDKEKQELSIFASQGIPEHLVDTIRVKVGEGAAGRVVLEGKPILVEDVDAEPALKMKHNRKFKTKSFLSVPLLSVHSDDSQGKVIGVINLTDKTSEETFTRRDVELASALASQASVAIQNSRLFDNLVQAHRELQEKSRTILEIQEQLIRSEKLWALGVLAASVAHEVNNPIASVSTYAQLLQMGISEEEKITKYAKIIEDNMKHISRIVGQLLDFARQDEPKKNDEEINILIRDTLVFTEHHLTRFKRVQVVTELGSDLPPVFIDKGQIQQVLVNLIMNAAQAMPEGGALTIQTAFISAPDLTGCRVVPVPEGNPLQGTFVQISLRDTGIGISEEDLKKIFQPFFTTKERGKGTGLGLSISQSIIERHGGFIAVESQVGVGTCFRILLPVVRD